MEWGSITTTNQAVRWLDQIRLIIEMPLFAIQNQVWLTWEIIIYKNKIKIFIIIIIMLCTNNVLSPNKLTGNHH